MKVDVLAEDPRKGEERQTTTSSFTSVALDDDGTPTPVPDLDCPTENQQALGEAAREQLSKVAEKIDSE